MRKADIMARMLILISCLIVPMLTFAQPIPPDDTPIDGGLSILLVAGAAYGVKKYREARKRHAEGEDNELK